MLLQAPRAVAMMAVSPGEAYCEDDTVLYYYIPEGVQKTNKGDAENEFHLWKLSLWVIYCPACVRPRVLLYNNADDSARTHTCKICVWYLGPKSKFVAFRRTRPHWNHHRRSTPPSPTPQPPVSALCFIKFFRKPFATYLGIKLAIYILGYVIT